MNLSEDLKCPDIQIERRKANIDNNRYLWLVTSKPEPEKIGIQQMV